jgi:predicted short-subunit dehydrogenase-like oxidoreductase (DUF2520 family)
VGVVGVGRVGSVLGAALSRAGHRVVAASAVSDASRRRAVNLLPDVPLRTPDEVAGAAELVLIAVPDDALEPLVAGLATAGAFRPGQLVAHTSGAHGLSVLAPARRAAALPLCLHPVMALSGAPEDLDRLSGAVFGITAEDSLLPVAQTLVLEMGGEPVVVPDDARALYHAALAFSSNYLMTLAISATDLLRGAGVEQPERLLAPLLGAALDNALRRGDSALVGPVARGDAGTVGAHLAVLRDSAPELLPAYVALARLTAERALASGRLDASAAEPLLEVLASRPSEAQA